MSEVICNIPVPQTPQQLEQAIQHYRETDLHGEELYCEFQAICEASLKQEVSEPDSDKVSGEDSY
ncbi:MAG: hypothetical protein WBB28_09150 [Crinalium sp.]